MTFLAALRHNRLAARVDLHMLDDHLLLALAAMAVQDRRLDRLGGQREWANALWAALEKVADREVAPLPANASQAHRKVHAKFEAIRAPVLAARARQ
jgi:hypothetical protein